jgi:DNA modification methylase
MINTILVGNVFDRINDIPDQYVDLLVTSPPYWGQRNYGTAQWLGGDENCNHEAARIKTRYDYSMGPVQRAYDNADAKIYKSVCPDCGGVKVDEQLGSETTYQEYLDKMTTLFMMIRRIMKPDGSVWVNMGDTYVSGSQLSVLGKQNLPKKTLMQIPSRFAIRMTDDAGYILRNTVIWHKPNPFPSSDPTKFTNDFEYFYWFTLSGKYYFEQQKEPSVSVNDGRYKQPRIEYDGKGSELAKSGDNKYQKSFSVINELRNKRTVWNIPTAGSEGRKSGLHVAPYPERLIETPIKACSPEDGIVFDPFMGSGTTGAVARRLGRNYLGIDLNPEYARFAMNRIKNQAFQLELFR